jgi:hypothetical protein
MRTWSRLKVLTKAAGFFRWAGGPNVRPEEADPALSRRVFYPVRMALKDAWSNSDPLEVLPSSAFVQDQDFDKFAGSLLHAARSEYSDAFASFGATAPVKYAIQPVVTIKPDRLMIQPEILLQRAGSTVYHLAVQDSTTQYSWGPKELAGLTALVAAYHLSTELMTREGKFPPPTRESETRFVAEFQTDLVAAVEDARQSDPSLPPPSADLAAALARADCEKIACVDSLVGSIQTWMDGQLDSEARTAAGITAAVAATN